MALLGFTGFNDLGYYSPTTEAGRLSAYCNYKFGINPIDNASNIVYFNKSPSGLTSRTQYGLGLISGGTGTSEYSVIYMNMTTLLLTSSAPVGTTLTFGCRATSIGTTVQVIPFLANNINASSANLTNLGGVNAPLATGGTSVYLEVQLKKTSATEISAKRRVNGAAATTVTVNQTYNNTLFVGMSGQLQQVASGSGIYLTDVYLALNTTGSDEWVGPLTVARSLPLNVADMGSLTPANMSQTSLDTIIGDNAKITTAASDTATSDSDPTASTALLSSEPLVLNQDQSSTINTSGIDVVGVSAGVWGKTVDASQTPYMTATIKDLNGNQLASYARPGGATTIYFCSTATVDLQNSDLDPGSLVFEFKNT